jgi:peptidoglycan/xylan/chitin deacetylase (PgdA/CDA1 family)
MKLYLSIDLESWVYPDIPAFQRLNSKERKKIDDGYIRDSTNRILDILSKYDQKITFFIIAEMFEWYPEIFESIRKAGHELAFHSYKHSKILNADILRKEIDDSREFLKEFKPIGFRAPNIFLPEEALATLVEANFLYSSSTYASYLDKIETNICNISEFPVSTLVYSYGNGRSIKYPRPLQLGMLAKEIPFGSGYFIASLPKSLIVKCINEYHKKEKPVFMFIHNWQIILPKGNSFPNTKYILKHPTYLPYTLSLTEKFEFFLKNFTIGKMEELCINSL